MATFNQLTPELITQLAAIVGEGNCYVGENISEDYSHDEMPIYGTKMPEMVVLPNSTDEVSQIMKLCYDNTIPVTVRGAGTGLAGGSTPLAGGVVLCTINMNQILEYDIDNFNVRIQPGVRLCDLAEDALKYDLMYPPDPGEKTGSVGGNVSTNAGGMRAVKYGTTRDYVLAMTVVLPNGEIMELGKAVTKNSSGYSLLHLMVGSEGTLGIITELTMKLIPNPSEDVSFLLPYENIEAAISAVPKIKLAGLDPRSIEFMERDIVDSSAEFTGSKFIPTVVQDKEVGGYILVTLDGNDADEIMTRAEVLVEIGDETGAYDVLVLQDSADKAAIWAARSAFLTCIEADTKFLDEMDVVVPVDKIAEFLQYVHEAGTNLGMRIRSFGHAGDGNLHIYCCSNDKTEEEFIKISEQVMIASYTKCTELGGAVSGEHGIGHAKKAYLEESVGETAFNLMKGIKAVFDPKGILNPGKICTDL